MLDRTDSFAGRSFADAEAALHELPFELPRVGPPLELTVSDAPNVRHAAGSSAVPQRWRWGGAEERVPVGALSKMPTIDEALALFASGALTSRELVEASLEVISATRELGAVVAFDEPAVIAEADLLDKERSSGMNRGPLHGVPLTVKDIIDVGGLPTRAGSLAYDDPHPVDAVPVARLRAAGAFILAKVATHEFALGVTTPQCRNPYDSSRLSGGSSGGSAIAVATGVGLGSLGTDTRASLRVPAHCCGVVGFKPTFGRVPTKGIVPLSWTVDHVGPITRTVRDAVLLLNTLADDPFLELREPEAASEMTVGIVPATFEDADPDVVARCIEALAVLEQLGCPIVELGGPSIDDLEQSNGLGLLVSRSEASTFHRAQGTDLKKCLPEVRDQLAAGLTISAADYLDAQRQRQLLGDRTLENFAQCDVIVMPTAPIVAPPRADYERFLFRLSRNTIIWSLIGAPALSMPCGLDANGMPVGLQLAAPPLEEQRLVTVGTALESALARVD